LTLGERLWYHPEKIATISLAANVFTANPRLGRQDYLLSFSSAILLILSFPNFHQHFLVWFALVPLISTLANKSIIQAFVLSLWTGVFFWIGIAYWLNVVEQFQLTDFALLVLIFAGYFGFFGLSLNLISRRLRLPCAYTAPVIWVSMEYLRSQAGAFSLPWGFLAHSQYLNLAVIQISSITGAYGVSFLVVMINAALSDIVVVWLCDANRLGALRKNRPVLIAAAVSVTFLGLTFAYGLWALRQTPLGNRVRVAVIQGNIPQNIRWNPLQQKQILEKHLNLSLEAAKTGRPRLIIWPETSVNGSITQNQNLGSGLAELARASNAYLLIGSAERPKFAVGQRTSESTSNSAFLFSPDGKILGRYDKIHLFPFGEYLPYKSLPWPSRIASHWQLQGFEPGNKFTVFRIEEIAFAVTICWENIFPNLIREFVRDGAKLIVNMTNEAWFGDTAAPSQFLSMSVFRAVENRVAIARAANTGISGFIDPFGRILGTVSKADKDAFVEGFLVKEIYQNQANTFYTRYGDLFTFNCVGAYLVMLLLSLVRRQTR
jgi:apolipoprotein N-acyltransferase